MFEWIQHLFTLHAILRERDELKVELEKTNANYKIAILQLQSEITTSANLIADKDAEIQRLKTQTEKLKQSHLEKPTPLPNIGIV